MAFKRDAVLASAEKLLARGKYDGALKEYLRILEENPNDILVLNKVGDLYVTINRPMDSIGYFTRIAEHYGKDGFFLKAIAIYKKINKIDPSRLEVYNLLGDLYHKQGLVPEARAQYQILADYYQKQNQLNDAIGVYKKMASVDPNDIKIPVKLADLLTSAGKTDEALMQYGVIGSMLVKRGAVDEAVSVYQKALKIRPGDTKILQDLVRSLIENGNGAAAAQLLKSQPRNATTMTLLAQALVASRNLEEARRAAEGAIAFEDGNEEARQILSNILLQQKEPGRAFEVVRPVLDKIVRAGEVKKAIGMITGLVEAGASSPALYEKLLELHRMTGDREGMIADFRLLAQAAESRRDSDAATAIYRQWLEIDPENAEARTRVAAFSSGAAPAPSQPSTAPAAPAAEPEEEVVLDIDDSALTTPSAPARATVSPSPLSLDWEEDFSFGAKGPAASPPPAAPEPSPAVTPPPAPPPRTIGEDTEWRNAVTEAEVFAKYGLSEKAAEKYRQLVRRRQDDLPLRRRYVDLLAEIRSPLLTQEAASLEAAYRAGGQLDEAEAVESRFLARPAAPGKAAAAPPAAPPLGFPPAAEPLPPPPPAPESARLTVAPIEESLPPPEPALPPPAAPAAVEFEEFATLSMPAPQPPASEPSPAAAPPAADLDFALDAGLGRAIEDEMARFQTVAPEEPPPPATPVDEMALFSDEQNFFNLAAELERELSEEEAPPVAPELESAGGEEASLEQIFKEFKKGVEQQLSPEDYETHYNLGIAYKEMGLTDEAIGEFQIASKDPARAVECCSMLGLCFLEKGLPQLAMQWYSRGLDNPGIKPEERLGLQYDLASIYEQTGESERAYQTFLDIYGQNASYRDVASRVKNLEAARRP